MKKTHFYVDISTLESLMLLVFPRVICIYITYGDDVAGRRSGVIIVNKFRTMFWFFCC